MHPHLSSLVLSTLVIAHSQPSSAQAPAVAPAPEASADDGTAARDAYAATLAAFTRGDAEAYFAGFAPTLECFHARPSVGVAEVRRSRQPRLRAIAGPHAPGAIPFVLRSIELRVLRAAPDEVELADFGWTGRGALAPDTVFHAKRILMRRAGGAWRIAVETPLREPGCGLAPVDAPPPFLWSQIRRSYRELLDRCECADEACPGIGGSIGCDPSSWPASAREACVSVPASERETCLAKAHDELRAFGLGDG